MITQDDIRQAAKACLIKAGTTFREDHVIAYQKAIESESASNPRWVLETLLENARIAESEQLPLCDDTGIPHVIAFLGENCALPPGWMPALHAGIVDGLREMPGRPMAVRGDDVQRVEQSLGLHTDPGMLDTAPVIVRPSSGDQLKLVVLLLGGGPEIRARTRRIFHRRSMDNVITEAGSWLSEEAGSLGCTPMVAAVGLGRSQVEASALMLEAMAEGTLDRQNEFETKLTHIINRSRVGPLGMGGETTALGAFIKIGPTRASGVRVVSARPCCCMEPRRAEITLG
jgi:fumarate hydratase subunit alpha